jgi:hypothetical protein
MSFPALACSMTTDNRKIQNVTARTVNVVRNMKVLECRRLQQAKVGV